MNTRTGSPRALAAALFFALLVVQVGCVSAASGKTAKAGVAPEWMTDLNASFPQAKYLAAVGQGDTRRDAESDAAGALSRIFNVNVKSDTLSTQRYQQIVQGDKTTVQSGMTSGQTVAMKSDADLINVRFSDPYSDSAGLTHVVAYLEREPTAAIYRQEIGQDASRIDGFSGRAAGAPSALQAYALYDSAYQVGLHAQKLLEQLRIIHAPSAALLEDSVSLQKIGAARDAEAAKLTYKISLAGDSDGRISGFVRESLAAQSLAYSPDGRLTVKGSWATAPEPSSRYKSLRWTLDIALYDESGAAIANAVKESRENGLTEADAMAFAYREAKKFLSKALTDSLQDYLARAVLK